MIERTKTALKKWVRRADPMLVPVIRTYLYRMAQGKGGSLPLAGCLYRLVRGAKFDFESTTFFGARIVGNTQEFLQQFIYYFGMWEPNLTRFVGERLAKGDTFIDVGANIGYFSLYASHLVGASGHVVSIEASPTIYRQLQANLARNNVSTARAINIAAADGRHTLQVFLAPEGNIGRTSVQNWNAFVEDWSGFAVECEIEALPLSEILTPEEIGAARLLKIDVEGSEWAVISGMDAVLAGSRPDLEIIVEISPERLARYGKSVADIFAVFGKRGFFPYRLDNDYTLKEYLGDDEKTRPARIREPILGRQADVVFSRRDQEML